MSVLEIVLDRYPQLRPRSDQQGFDAQFRVAFQRLLHSGRRDKLDVNRGLEFWTDDARTWSQQHSPAVTVLTNGAAFVAALVSQGDVPYAPLDNFPCDLGFGLQAYGGGRPSAGCWRVVLETGGLLEPTPLDRPVAIKSPSRVRQLAIGLSGYR